MGSCLPLDDPNNAWSFCPSKGAAYFFAILFGLTTCAHFAQAIYFKKGYSWVIIMGGIWQTVAFAFRIVSIQQPTNDTMYSIWFVLILVAPLWLNAFVYMIMGRMVYNFLPSRKLFGVKAWRFGLYFVLADITAFLIQAAGASIASGNDKPAKTTLLGIHIYMGGIGFQEFFILLFSCLAVRFHRKIALASPVNGSNISPMRLLYAIYAVLTLITIRVIFRLAEYAKGFKSTIPNHEAYMYVLDSLPMLVAIVLFNVIHPGAVMPGKASDFPSRKQRKAEKQAAKATGIHTLKPIDLSPNPSPQGQGCANYFGDGTQPQSYEAPRYKQV